MILRVPLLGIKNQHEEKNNFKNKNMISHKKMKHEYVSEAARSSEPSNTANFSSCPFAEICLSFNSLKKPCVLVFVKRASMCQPIGETL